MLLNNIGQRWFIKDFLNVLRLLVNSELSSIVKLTAGSAYVTFRVADRERKKSVRILALINRGK